MTVIKIKNSAVAGRVPASGDIEVAELALNLADKKLYSKDASGSIFEIGEAGDLPSGENPPSSGNNPGDLFYNTKPGEEGLYYWDGSAWILLTSEPADGDGYVKISGDRMTGALKLGPDGGLDQIALAHDDGTAVFAGGDIIFNGDGSATLTKYVSVATESSGAYYATSTDASNDARAAFRAESSDGTPTFNLKFNGDTWVGGDILANQPNINLSADGSASFASGVGIGTDSPAVGIHSNAETNQFLATDSITSDHFYVQVTDGVASINTYFSNTSRMPLRFMQYITETMRIDSSGNVLIGGALPDSPNTTLNADGSASFAGEVVVGQDGPGLPKVRINPDGYINAQGTSTSAEVIRVFDNTATQNATIFADGSANFAGAVEANGGFTVNGVSVQSTVADVNAMRETFQELQVAVANATDFAGLKAAMLVALEDYAA